MPFIIKGPSFADGAPSCEELGAFREKIPDSNAVALFDYWLSKLSGDGLPHRSQLDPTEIPRLLTGIFVEEWDDEHQQSRIRLAGEFHREPDDTSIQGRLVDDLTEGETRDVWRQCDT